jgi:F-type H+-transporting ATPase subunit O
MWAATKKETDCQVDKKLLGGFVLEFEDRLVDKSDAKKKEEFAALVAKMEGDLA